MTSPSVVESLNLTAAQREAIGNATEQVLDDLARLKDIAGSGSSRDLELASRALALAGGQLSAEQRRKWRALLEKSP